MIGPRIGSWSGMSLAVAFCALVALLSFGTAAAIQIAGGPPTSGSSPSRSECPVLAECPSVGERATVVARDGSALWVSHLGPPGPGNDPNTLYRMDPVTCTVLRQIPTPGSGPSGLDFVEGTLIHGGLQHGDDLPAGHRGQRARFVYGAERSSLGNPVHRRKTVERRARHGHVLRARLRSAEPRVRSDVGNDQGLLPVAPASPLQQHHEQ